MFIGSLKMKNTRTSSKHTAITMEYKELNLHQHTLKRPDTYIGSIKPEESCTFIMKDDRIVKTTITLIPGLTRLFIEAMSNAIDNVYRSKSFHIKSKSIKMEIQPDGTTVMWNDGMTIPVRIHEDTGVYIPEMLFGRLLTSSNYDDTEARTTSGRNGLGVSLTNVFSTSFSIKICDPPYIYRQTWSDNMTVKSKPKITKTKVTNGYTEVTWLPDFRYFKCDGYSSDTIALFRKYAFDTAMLTGQSVFFNKKKIPVQHFKDYSTLYNTSDEKIKPILLKHGDSVECMILPSTESNSISFVNGIHTRDGGTHVSPWVQQVFKWITDKINTKYPSNKITAKDIKSYFTFIVKAVVVNPEFESQSKNRLVSPSIPIKVQYKDIKSIMNWSFVKKIEELIALKDREKLKGNERKRGFVRIDGFDPANKAGTKHSKKCSLILCEGKSAKPFAVTGIEMGCTIDGELLKGRDWFGILPLKGKLLNVRNASNTSIAGNDEIKNIIQALGATFGTNYTASNRNQLRYGRIIILCDQDVDGFHITGLILNLFECLFPSLLTLPGFIVWMNTPIIRVDKRRFYTIKSAKEYIATLTKKADVKYFKGLGTSNTKDIKETFGKRMIQFEADEQHALSLRMIFDSKYSAYRKKWLTDYIPSEYNAPTKSMGISNFINQDLIQYSIDDCKRSIPHLMDGLKESQRKILYATMKKNPVQTIKVAQLAGYIAENTNYHHGEASMCQTITNMAQDYVGSNNLPLLVSDGQFGSRLHNGKDASSPRYIFTKVSPWTCFIFSDSDSPVLHYREEEGMTIEPIHYTPIIPMLFVNGVKGSIGTGWSCSLPNYNPKDLISYCEAWIQKKPLPTLTPWYRGFKGTIEKITSTKHETTGVYTVEKNILTITELPIGISTEAYKTYLETLLENKRITKFLNYSKTETPHFIVTMDSKKPLSSKELRMTSTLSTGNITLFDCKDQIKQYKSIHTIIDEYCIKRVEVYVERIDFMLTKYKVQRKTLESKLAFLTLVNRGDIKLWDKEDDSIKRQLEHRKLYKVDDSYDYLLSMNIRNFTKRFIKTLQDQITKTRERIEYYQKTTPTDIWLSELELLKKHLP